MTLRSKPSANIRSYVSVLVLLIAGVCASNAAAQINVVSQDRHVAASATCTSCGSDSQRFDATDLNPFMRTARVDLTGSSSSFASGVAVQNSEINDTQIICSLQANRFSRNGSASAESLCAVTFVLHDACTYNISAQASGSPIPSTVSLTGAHGSVFNQTLFLSQTFSGSGVLLPGQYVLSGLSSVNGGGGSTMGVESGVQFTFTATTLPSPGVLVGPIVNPANCHTYYGLARSGWAQGEAKARELGGHLVTMNDAEENHWVYQNFANVNGMGEYVWLGITNLDHPGTTQYEWISGEASAYTNWAFAPVASPPAFGLMLSHNTPYGERWVVSDDSYSIDIVSGVVEVASACPCDWTMNGTLNSEDFFAFLTGFFSGNADFDCSGSTTSQDFFGFVECFFGGCV